MAMIGMNTRMIDSPPGIIYHTPVRDLFKPDPSAKVWYVGENFPESVSVKVIKREEGEVEVVDQILERAEELFKMCGLDRSAMRLTTRTCRGYPITTWSASSTAGQGPSRSVPTTHALLVYALPADQETARVLWKTFRLLQPYNCIHVPQQMNLENRVIDTGDGPITEEERKGPILLTLHLGSVPGKDEDLWVMTDLYKDLVRGWKKSILTSGPTGSQRIWVSFEDGRQTRQCESYNNMEQRPFADRTPDL